MLEVSDMGFCFVTLVNKIIEEENLSDVCRCMEISNSPCPEKMRYDVCFIIHCAGKYSDYPQQMFPTLAHRIRECVEHFIENHWQENADLSILKRAGYAIHIKYHYESVEENKEEFKVKPFIVIPEVEEIIHRKSDRGEFFTVVWADNTKTTVKLMEGEESDDYSAFMYCVGKKMFADKGVARRFIADKKAVFENRMAEISEKRAEFKAMKNFENAVLNDPDFPEEIVPVIVSRDIFRRNRG